MDGTLIDSQEGIFSSIRYALDKMGKPCPSQEVLRGFVGPSLGDSFQRITGLSLAESEEAVRLYREFYGDGGLRQCRLYPGMRELLARLASQGKRAAVATKKPEPFAREIVRFLGVEGYFSAVSGATLQERHNDKRLILERAMEEMGVADRSLVLMAGDSEYDCDAAVQAGVDCLGVGYGFGDSAVMLAHGAAAVVPSVEALTELLCEGA